MPIPPLLVVISCVAFLLGFVVGVLACIMFADKLTKEIEKLPRS